MIDTEGCELSDSLKFVYSPVSVFFDKPIGIIWAIVKSEIEEIGKICVKSCANFISLVTCATKSYHAIELFSKDIWMYEKTTKKSAEGVANWCLEALGCKAVIIWEADHSSRPPMLSTLISRGNCGPNLSVDVPISPASIAGSCASSCKIITIDDFDDVILGRVTEFGRIRHPELVKAMGWKSGFFAPLDVGGQMAGVIAVYAERKNAFSAIDKNIVLSFAQRLTAGYTHISRLNELEGMENSIRREAPYIETGILATEHVHDAFNSLGITQAYLGNIIDKFKNEPESNAFKWTKIASENTDHSLKLLKILIDGADITKVNLGRKNVFNTINMAISQVDEDAKLSKIHIEVECPEIFRFEHDQQQIIRVFKNFLDNSIFFLGTLSRKKKIIKITAYQEKDFVKIHFFDNGPGIAEDDLDKVFDYLYTTKGPHKGLGFGLAIAKRIIKDNHSGTIEIKSTWGSDTEFIVKLPLER